MQFLIENSIYVALVVAVMVMIGMVVYLNRIDSRLRRLEQELDASNTQSTGA